MLKVRVEVEEKVTKAKQYLELHEGDLDGIRNTNGIQLGFGQKVK